MSERRAVFGLIVGLVLVFVNMYYVSPFILGHWEQMPSGWWILSGFILLSVVVFVLGTVYAQYASFAAAMVISSLLLILLLPLMSISIEPKPGQYLSEEGYNNTLYLLWAEGVGIYFLQIYEFALVGITELVLKTILFGPGPKYRMMSRTDVQDEQRRQSHAWPEYIHWCGYRLTDSRLTQLWSPEISEEQKQGDWTSGTVYSTVAPREPLYTRTRWWFEIRNNVGKWVRCADPRRPAPAELEPVPTN